MTDPTRSLTCRDVVDLLADFLGATLRDADVQDLERHLADCTACRAYLATYRKTVRLTGRAVDAEMPDEMKRRLRVFLVERFAR